MSDRRPDIFIYLDDRYINIEIDEKQHTHKQYDDDKLRNEQIHDDVNDAPLLVVRFNPHSYKSGKVRHGSCWTTNEASEKYICDADEWNDRLWRLKNVVMDYIALDDPEPLTVTYLFYND